MADVDVETKMDALRKRLVDAVKVQGVVTYKQLSLALNQNETFVQQFVTKRSPKRLFDNQINIIERMIKDAQTGAVAVPAPPAVSPELASAFERLSSYPAKLQDRVVSFAEYEMSRYDQSRENETTPESKSK